jgi:hypothetical protein
MDSLKPKREWKRHKVQPGHNIFRILPPFGESSNGYPYRKWMITWGLTDPETGRLRPFASSLNSKDKACPIFEYVDALTKKAEGIKSEMKASGASDAEVKERLKELNKLISNLRPKTVYAYNAINKAGEVGLLEIKATAHKKLKELMMQYIQDYNQDPTSLNSEVDDSGVWFDITRTGEGFDTTYDVCKVQVKSKDANGRTTFVDDQSPLTEGVVAGYENSAYDLSSIYQVKSYEELKSILLANIAVIAETIPEAVVPGFEVEGVQAVASAPQVQPSTPAVNKATGTKKVNLNFGSDEDERDDEVPAVSTNTKAPVVAKAATIDDDVFAMADSILGN